MTNNYDLTTNRYDIVYYYYNKETNKFYFISSGINIDYFIYNSNIDIINNNQYSNTLSITMDRFINKLNKYNNLFNYIINFNYSPYITETNNKHDKDYILINKQLSDIINNDEDIIYLQVYLIPINNVPLDNDNIDNIVIAYDYTTFNKYIKDDGSTNFNESNNINWCYINNIITLDNNILYIDKFKYIEQQIKKLLPDSYNRLLYLYDKYNIKNNIVFGKQYNNGSIYSMILVCISIEDILLAKFRNVSDILMYGNLKIYDNNNNSILSVNSNDNTITIKNKLGINNINPQGLLDINGIDTYIIQKLLIDFINIIYNINNVYHNIKINISKITNIELEYILGSCELFSCEYRIKDFDLTKIYCTPLDFIPNNIYNNTNAEPYISELINSYAEISNYKFQSKLWIYDFFKQINSTNFFVDNTMSKYNQIEYSQIIISNSNYGPKLCYIIIFNNPFYTVNSDNSKYYCIFNGLDIYRYTNNKTFTSSIINIFNNISKSLDLLQISRILLKDKLLQNIELLNKKNYNKIIYDYNSNDFKLFIDNYNDSIYKDRFGNTNLYTYTIEYNIRNDNRCLYNEINKYDNGKLSKYIQINNTNFTVLDIINQLNELINQNYTNIIYPSIGYYLDNNIFYISLFQNISIPYENTTLDFIIITDTNINTYIDNIKINGEVIIKGNFLLKDNNNNNKLLLNNINDYLQVNTKLGINTNNPKAYLDIDNIDYYILNNFMNYINVFYRTIIDLTDSKTYGIFDNNIPYEYQNNISKYELNNLNSLKYKNLKDILSNKIFAEIANNIQINNGNTYINITEYSNHINNYINNYIINDNDFNYFNNTEDEYIVLLCHGYEDNKLTDYYSSFYFVYHSLKRELDGYSIQNMLNSNNYDENIFNFFMNFFNKILNNYPKIYFLNNLIQIFYFTFDSEYYIIISKIIIDENNNNNIFQLLYIVNILKYLNINCIKNLFFFNYLEIIPVILQCKVFEIFNINLDNNLDIFNQYKNYMNSILQSNDINVSMLIFNYDIYKNYLYNKNPDIFSQNDLILFLNFLLDELPIFYYNSNFIIEVPWNELIQNYEKYNIKLDELKNIQNIYRYIIYQLVFKFNIYNICNLNSIFQCRILNNNYLIFLNTYLSDNNRLHIFLIEYNLSSIINLSLNINGNNNINGILNISNNNIPFIKIDPINKFFNINATNFETNYLLGYKTLNNFNPFSGLILQNAIISNNNYPNLVVERITDDSNIESKSINNSRSALSIRRTSKQLLINEITENNNYGIDCAFEIQDRSNNTYEIGNIGFNINNKNDNNYPKGDFFIKKCEINNKKSMFQNNSNFETLNEVVQDDIFKVSNDGNIELPIFNSSIIFNINNNTKYEFNISEDEYENPIFKLKKIKNNIKVKEYVIPCL